MNSLLKVPLTIAIGFTMTVSVFAEIKIVQPVLNNTSRFQFVANWTFEPAVQENDRIGALLGPWFVIVDSQISADGIHKTPTLNYVHERAPHGEGSTMFLREVSLGEFSRPAAGRIRKAKAAQFSHGNHFDIIRVLGQLPAVGDGSITTTGDHTIRQLGTWSALGIDGQVRVKAKTNTGREYTPENGDPQNVRPRDHVGGSLNRQADGLMLSPDERPAEYTVYAAVGGATLPADPLTVTTLSFLGEVDGMPGQLDFAAAAQAFDFLDVDFFAPILVDAATLADTYVAIDLSQWLALGSSVGMNDVFTFSSGHSEQLPGIMASSTPFVFNSTTGQYESNTPFAGDLMIAGFIDGGAEPVPEPRSWALTVIGAAGLALCTRCGHRVPSPPGRSRRSP